MPKVGHQVKAKREAQYDMRRWLAGLLLGSLLVGPSGSLYDAHGRRQGYIRESRPGHFDLYDAHSRRLGYGRVAPDGRIDFYDRNSRRILEIRPDRVRPQR